MKSVCALVLLQVAVLLLACSGVSLASPRPEDFGVNVSDEGASSCGKNEVFKTCGPSCQTNCQIINSGEQLFCTDQCVEGCFCKHGYVRNSRRNSKCIRIQECPRVKN